MPSLFLRFVWIKSKLENIFSMEAELAGMPISFLANWHNKGSVLFFVQYCKSVTVNNSFTGFSLYHPQLDILVSCLQFNQIKQNETDEQRQIRTYDIDPFGSDVVKVGPYPWNSYWCANCLCNNADQWCACFTVTFWWNMYFGQLYDVFFKANGFLFCNKLPVIFLDYLLFLLFLNFTFVLWI